MGVISLRENASSFLYSEIIISASQRYSLFCSLTFLLLRRCLVPGCGIVRVILPVKKPSDWTLTIKRQHHINKATRQRARPARTELFTCIQPVIVINYTANQQTPLSDELFPFRTSFILRIFESANRTNASQDHVGFGCIPFHSPAQIRNPLCAQPHLDLTSVQVQIQIRALTPFQPHANSTTTTKITT